MGVQVHEQVESDPKDFMILASMAFSFYFASKGETSQPFAGK